MLDKLTSAILNIVNEQTDGSYKVLETSDFINMLPGRVRTDAAGIENALQYLSERGYIDLRYSEKGTYCITSLPKGRTYTESVMADKSKGKRTFKNQMILTFFGAMLGAFCGGCLAGLLFLFVL